MSDILCVLELLAHLASKDFVDFSEEGEGRLAAETVAEVSEGVIEGVVGEGVGGSGDTKCGPALLLGCSGECPPFASWNTLSHNLTTSQQQRPTLLLLNATQVVLFGLERLLPLMTEDYLDFPPLVRMHTSRHVCPSVFVCILCVCVCRRTTHTKRTSVAL